MPLIAALHKHFCMGAPFSIKYLIVSLCLYVQAVNNAESNNIGLLEYNGNKYLIISIYPYLAAISSTLFSSLFLGM